MAAGTVLGTQLRRLLTGETGGQESKNGSEPEKGHGRHGVVVFNDSAASKFQNGIQRPLNPILC
jgi:hypothetical protein